MVLAPSRVITICRNCGTRVHQALSPTGQVVSLDLQVSMVGDWRLKQGPDSMAFAVRDLSGPGERYDRHDGHTCRGVVASGAQYRA
jgi:hypothetical protein